jgi:hypothetical protein
MLDMTAPVVASLLQQAGKKAFPEICQQLSMGATE